MPEPRVAMQSQFNNIQIIEALEKITLDCNSFDARYWTRLQVDSLRKIANMIERELNYLGQCEVTKCPSQK